MKLPFAADAEVSEAKIVLYLLNLNHRDGGGKARFFRARGFAPESWGDLANALRRHAIEHEVARQSHSSLGITWVIEGLMAMPDETVALVRSVWFIESGEQIPRFVTAYPLRQKKKYD